MITYASASFGFSFTARSAAASASRRLLRLNSECASRPCRVGRVRVGVARRRCTSPPRRASASARTPCGTRTAAAAPRSRARAPCADRRVRSSSSSRTAPSGATGLRPGGTGRVDRPPASWRRDEAAARVRDRHDDGLHRRAGGGADASLLHLAAPRRAVVCGRCVALDREDDGDHDHDDPGDNGQHPLAPRRNAQLVLGVGLGERRRRGRRRAWWSCWRPASPSRRVRDAPGLRLRREPAAVHRARARCRAASPSTCARTPWRSPRARARAARPASMSARPRRLLHEDLARGAARRARVGDVQP